MKKRDRVIRVSAAQMSAEFTGRNFAEKQKSNLAEIKRMLEIAGKRRSDIVLFAEYANLHHRSTSNRKSEYVADSIPGPFTKAVSRAAKKYRMNIVMPVFGRYNGTLSSFAIVFDRSGTIIGCYQKTHPTEPEMEMGIRRGNDLRVLQLDCARIGIMTCMDIEYPEVAQVLMLRGAEILLFPHVQGSWGEIDWEIRYRARAIDTGLFVVSSCYGYPEGEWMPGKMIGRSSIVGRDGLILADMGRSIGVLTSEINLDRRRITQFFFNKKHDRTSAIIASRRPEIYHDLTEIAYKQKAVLSLRNGTKKSKH
jgi:predicted amidohydrolase